MIGNAVKSTKIKSNTAAVIHLAIYDKKNNNYLKVHIIKITFEIHV